jgi:hypothetical protein
MKQGRDQQTEFAGGRGRNDRLPNGDERPLTAQERAQDMRRAGLRFKAGSPEEKPPREGY